MKSENELWRLSQRRWPLVATGLRASSPGTRFDIGIRALPKPLFLHHRVTLIRRTFPIIIRLSETLREQDSRIGAGTVLRDWEQVGEGFFCRCGRAGSS